MNKKIAQIRYYGNKNKNNQPSSIRLNDLISGEVFKEFYPIYQINIQGDSRTAFHINHDVNTVIIGPLGIYNLDLEDFSSITFTIDFCTRSGTWQKAKVGVDF